MNNHTTTVINSLSRIVVLYEKRAQKAWNDSAEAYRLGSDELTAQFQDIAKSYEATAAQFRTQLNAIL